MEHTDVILSSKNFFTNRDNSCLTATPLLCALWGKAFRIQFPMLWWYRIKMPYVNTKNEKDRSDPLWSEWLLNQIDRAGVNFWFDIQYFLSAHFISRILIIGDVTSRRLKKHWKQNKTGCLKRVKDCWEPWLVLWMNEARIHWTIDQIKKRWRSLKAAYKPYTSKPPIQN